MQTFSCGVGGSGAAVWAKVGWRRPQCAAALHAVFCPELPTVGPSTLHTAAAPPR